MVAEQGAAPLEGRDDGVAGYLTALASDAPAPGGGAAAALQAAIGAALVSMVCNLTVGRPKFAEHEETIQATLAAAESLRVHALALAEQDAAAFSAVTDAYRLPKGTDEERAARTAAIQEALRGAAQVPLRTAELGADVVRLAGALLDRSNPNVLSDVGVAAVSARAAIDAAVINVKVNLGLLTDDAFRKAAEERLAPCLDAAAEAGELARTVEGRLGA